ncbi:MAG TPA: cell division protein FtsB [Steroidobacteraceae bacterium]|jgi:cell division protein FtsB|nr:cell division protein FtsB [Steroidobacteraceae bacterium]
MRWLATALVFALILLQYRIWVSDDGLRGVGRLQHAVAAQQKLNATLTQRNSRLAAEVQDLKSGTAAIEERARSDLGMIGANETFYQVVEPAPAGTASGGPTPKVVKEGHAGN